MKFFIGFFCILLICCLASTAYAECCKPSKILFKIAENSENNKCSTFGAKEHAHDTCEKTICGNGDGVKGTWCGKHRCNPFGCHCKGGCLPGDAVESFRAKYGFFKFIYVAYA